MVKNFFLGDFILYLDIINHNHHVSSEQTVTSFQIFYLSN